MFGYFCAANKSSVNMKMNKYRLPMVSGEVTGRSLSAVNDGVVTAIHDKNLINVSLGGICN